MDRDTPAPARGDALEEILGYTRIAAPGEYKDDPLSIR